jgi:DNA-binding response OmpR family regulator
MNEKIKVLLVEDDPLIIRMYETKFKVDGFIFSTAFNGEEGIEAMKNDRPDIVLLDIMMPKMNGLEMLKVVKEDDNLKNIPVVILTNLGDRPEDIKKFREIGADDYWVKANTSLKEITNRIKEILAVKKENAL